MGSTFTCVQTFTCFQTLKRFAAISLSLSVSCIIQQGGLGVDYEIRVCQMIHLIEPAAANAKIYYAGSVF